MLTAYKLYESTHMQLHLFMIDFFKAMSIHRGDFTDNLIPEDFRLIAKKHKKVIYNRLKVICTELNKLNPDAQKEFCDRIVSSNDIESICKRKSNVLSIADIPDGIRQTTIDLFLALYSQILRGDNTYSKKYGAIKDHFIKFRELNSDITVCPFCGITELKTQFDKALEQYDHYFPKTLYPFSAVNFLNLIPTCKDCNGLDYKSDKDTLKLGTEKLFYPYSAIPYQIKIEFKVVKHPEIKNWDWSVSISGNGIDLDEEIISWDRIYDIKSRYIAHVKGRIVKWLNFYLEYKRRALLLGKTEDQIKKEFLTYMEIEEEFGLEFLRRPVYMTCLND